MSIACLLLKPDTRLLRICRHVSLMRAVIREDLSMSMVDELVNDIKRAIEFLDTHYVFTQSQVFSTQQSILRPLPHISSQALAQCYIVG